MFSKFYDCKKSHGYIEDVGEVRGGGHALMIYGYVTINNMVYFKIKNSWSSRWGNDGKCYIKSDTLFDVIKYAAAVNGLKKLYNHGPNSINGNDHKGAWKWYYIFMPWKWFKSLESI